MGSEELYILKIESSVLGHLSETSGCICILTFLLLSGLFGFPIFYYLVRNGLLGPFGLMSIAAHSPLILSIFSRK